MSDSMLFRDVVRERHSVRSFLPHPVPEDILRSVLEDAQHTPSNCNTQPWQTHIVSGSKKDVLSKAILAADDAGQLTPDFSFGINDFPGVYRERYKEQGAAYYQAIGVKRDDKDLRREASRRNLEFFGAPHVALLFMPEVGDNVRVAGDIGMYAQTLLLSLTAHGLGGVPQTSLGFYGETIRKELGVDPSLKLLFGISLGYPDITHPANQYRINKVSLGESVTFHQ
ncbi:nitroreductase [Escherichia coli]|uniref:Nitroreductase n=1 Tax=Enterobacter quasihormaechei TaxID=2529382 RepID=A0ABU9PNA7_9ENTR|nr:MULTISPECIES: nitroreductase [Enterobacteriaceae]EAS6634537.1 nitroreductase [Salmonella enterica]HBR1984220.1 nitroreductase [Klebsiella quasipneumoniae subsp. quasipneumoniae]HDU5235226.1 nitroreductase [Klebsiella pneumoniae subsp. pneumoniae]EGO0280015.1 nitroreductase [Escherichia coli]EKM0496857.1 nitroreductase [Escherichia coli]